MSKKPSVDVNENMLLNAMLDVPGARNQQSPSPPPPAAPPRESEPEPARREAPRKKVSYRERFLVNDGARSRVTTAIDRDIHKKMRRLLSMVAPEVTVVAYISNVLAHHLAQFESEINELYKHEVEKPL